MAARNVTSPDGVRWTVRRRWYPWRRAMSIRDTWNSTPDGTEAAQEGAVPEGAEGESAEKDSGLPKNFLLKALFITLAAIVWVVIGVGKVLLYGTGAAIFIVISLAELALQLIVMPFALLLRATGASRWPVQINRDSKHFGTKYADGYESAAALRDDLAGRLEHGMVPAMEPVDAT